MIRTDIDIKDDVFYILQGSELLGEVSGSVYKDQRPLNSQDEDIIISLLARDAGYQIQQAEVNVNIYVPDISRGLDKIENTIRLRLLSTKAAALFEYIHRGNMIISLASQEIVKVNGLDWHVINNRLRIYYNNETT